MVKRFWGLEVRSLLRNGPRQVPSDINPWLRKRQQGVCKGLGSSIAKEPSPYDSFCPLRSAGKVLLHAQPHLRYFLWEHMKWLSWLWRPEFPAPGGVPGLLSDGILPLCKGVLSSAGIWSGCCMVVVVFTLCPYFWTPPLPLLECFWSAILPLLIYFSFRF